MKFLQRTWLKALAAVAVLIGMRRRAVELYRDIYALDPSDVAAGATVGAMLMELKDEAGATDIFLNLLERHPEFADGWFNLGYIYDQRDALGEAEQCFRRALQINPQHDRAWYGLALVLIRTERLDEAVDALKHNIKLQPFSPYGFYQLAMTQHHLGDSAAAWRVYEQLKLFEPKFAAGLRRDLEQTPARFVRAAATDSTGSSEAGGGPAEKTSDSSPSSLKEALNPVS